MTKKKGHLFLDTEEIEKEYEKNQEIKRMLER